jgi:hypothetical protein
MCKPGGVIRHVVSCRRRPDVSDEEMTEIYLDHPDHRAVGARLVSATEGGVDGLVVLDWEFSGDNPPGDRRSPPRQCVWC